MAGNAFEVGAVSTHVHVEVTSRIDERHGQIAVFDVVAAAGFGVAVDAVINRAPAAVHRNTLCDQLQINCGLRETGRGLGFRIGRRLVVADEAVGVIGVAKIKRLAAVAITSVAVCAAAFVRRHGNTEVVQNVVLAMDFALEAFDVRGDAFPCEVACRDELIGDLAVAVQA